MDAKFGDTVAYRFHVAKKSSFKPLDPSDHNATNRRVCQVVEPRGELWERFNTEHDRSVIERLHFVDSGVEVGPRRSGSHRMPAHRPCTDGELCHQPKSFAWRARGAKPHPLATLGDAAFAQAYAVLNQIIGIEQA